MGVRSEFDGVIFSSKAEKHLGRKPVSDISPSASSGAAAANSSLPRWMRRAISPMCKEGADVYLAWHLARSPFHREEREHLDLYEETKRDARNAVIHHNLTCQLCRTKRPSLFKRVSLFLRGSSEKGSPTFRDDIQRSSHE